MNEWFTWFACMYLLLGSLHDHAAPCFSPGVRHCTSRVPVPLSTSACGPHLDTRKRDCACRLDKGLILTQGGASGLARLDKSLTLVLMLVLVCMCACVRPQLRRPWVPCLVLQLVSLSRPASELSPGAGCIGASVFRVRRPVCLACIACFTYAVLCALHVSHTLSTKACVPCMHRKWMRMRARPCSCAHRSAGVCMAWVLQIFRVLCHLLT